MTDTTETVAAVLTVPAGLLALELTRRLVKAGAEAWGIDPSNHAPYYSTNQQVADHLWFKQHPGASPERRTARRALRIAADHAYAVMRDQELNEAAIFAEVLIEQLAREAGR